MPLKKLGRPWAVVLGVTTLASLGWWASEQFHPHNTRFEFIEPVSKRKYGLVVRADHDPRQPAPVLFALHAYSTAPDVLVRSYLLDFLAVKNRGFILVIPEGMRDDQGRYFWNASQACCGEGPSRPDDLGYLRGVLADVRSRFSVDDKRVVAVGVSNGGFMAHRWACCANSELTAIASISGAGPGPSDPACTPSNRVSVLQVHGDQDELIAYGGGAMRDGDYPSARNSIAPYLHASDLNSEPGTRTTRTLLFGTIRKEEWKSPTSRISLWTVEGGGHHLRAAQASVLEILDFLQGS